ncbi:MAG: glutaredoxin domain-containing protein [Actinomycetota bacterium]|jgi:glutaredoxin-like YruB-family protein|nr:glutaredoxin domain-containing protein [Actinomycetota bacterium]
MKKVIVYSTSACPYCSQVKDYLRRHNIEFSDIDISVHPEKLSEMAEKSKQVGIPVIDFMGKIIVGFEKEEIDRAIQELDQ